MHQITLKVTSRNFLHKGQRGEEEVSQQSGAKDVLHLPVVSLFRKSAQTSLRHINLPANAEDVGQVETQLDITLTIHLSNPFTSLKRNWFRALPSDWLEHFVPVSEASMFTTAFVDRWRPQ